MDTLSVSRTLLSASSPPVASGRPVGGCVQDQLAVERPSSLIDAWCGAYSSSDGPAVVTVGWVGDVAVLAILLIHDRVPVAIGLDASQQLVADVVRQWSTRAALTLTVRHGDNGRALEVGVHVDAVVHSVMMSCKRTQEAADFRQAVAAYSDMEHMLSRLAGTHRIRWAVGEPTAVPARARLVRSSRFRLGCDASPAC